jgi:hypothetical protein
MAGKGDALIRLCPCYSSICSWFSIITVKSYARLIALSSLTFQISETSFPFVQAILYRKMGQENIVLQILAL